jgi:hypothetical protein
MLSQAEIDTFVADGYVDLERLDPDDEDERTFLLEAQHLDMAEALERREEMTGADGEPFNPQLHVTLHQVVAKLRPIFCGSASSGQRTVSNGVSGQCW